MKNTQRRRSRSRSRRVTHWPFLLSWSFDNWGDTHTFIFFPFCVPMTTYTRGIPLRSRHLSSFCIDNQILVRVPRPSRGPFCWPVLPKLISVDSSPNYPSLYKLDAGPSQLTPANDCGREKSQ